MLKPSKLRADFIKFLLRGNVVDLAVGVVIGAAFGTVIAAVVKDLITPLIGIIQRRDYSQLTFTVRGSTFNYGDLINAVVSFFLIAVVLFFFVILPINAMVARQRKSATTSDPTTKKCPECLSEVPIAARRCAFCTSVIEAAAAT
ncbi:MAG: large conductance mechanosensitive channel protein MscL [Dehalococcoidia bacterium]|nr:large conductance mechanosensitive channel protein MscL [Dehalococcoidia bacterium]